MFSQLRPIPAWIVCAVFAGGVSPSLAASINHGNFGPDFPPGITIYQDVQESSGTDPVPPQRYGPPTLSGNTLDFRPTQFVASATGSDSDIIDGQLNFNIRVPRMNDMVAGGMDTLLVSESGDFSLFGTGTAVTSLAGGISIDVDILEVDGTPITPISIFASNSAVRDLVTDGPVVLAPWNNAVLFEFGPVLIANNIAFDFGVTMADVVINDQLITISEPNSVAFVSKKEFAIEPGIVPNPDFDFQKIPEPSSWALTVGVLACLPLWRRRRTKPHTFLDRSYARRCSS